MTLILIVSHSVVACAFFLIGGLRLRKTVARHLGPMQSIASEMIGSADQVGAISRDLGAASQEQLDSLNMTTSASDEIRSMTEATSENAGHLNAEASRLHEMTETGGLVIKKMVASSEDIKEGALRFSSEMQDSVDQLTQAMNVIQEIAQKTQVISEIVFQTKLLSFNASVEAARAGEAGKGFAVVAQEVGQLAQMSGNASAEITTIVERSVSVVQSAIRTTKEKISEISAQTVAKGEAGHRDAKDCEKIFAQMSGKIHQITQMIDQISSAAKEQAIGVTQLNQSVRSLQEVADRNRLVASQTNEYGHEFGAQTQLLSQSVETMAKQFLRAAAQKKSLQKFQWSSRLELGVKEMDDEHLILVEKINALVSELENRSAHSDDGRLSAAFTDLAEYTQEHFSDEEAFMESIAYRQLPAHRKIHERLLAEVAKYGEELRSGRLDDQKLISFLRNWLISHIMGVDMQYAAFYKSSASPAARKVRKSA